MNRHIHFALLAAALLAAAPAFAAGATYSDCVRDAGLDLWASYDNAFCQKIMAEVFKGAGIDARRLPFAPDGSFDPGAEVICSAFRTPELLEKYDFPLQPLGRMHYALYTTADRAMTMMSTRITEWPTLRVGYSPVSQGQTRDREDYFARARLSPLFVEFPTSAGAVEALRTNAVDALFLYTPLGKRPEGLVEIVPMGERNVYFAVRKDRPELLRALEQSYRDFYIDHIDRIDAWRGELLGIPKPAKRVRLAAYSRGNFFAVSPDGVRSGALETWMKALCGHTHWSVDYVYGNYDQCLEDVRNGRLDLLGGIGFTTDRRDLFLYPHTPIGMLRVYLWTRGDSPYQEGDPATWAGMRVGLLGGTVSSERAKRQFQSDTDGVSCVEYATDRALVQAFKNGEIDALVDVEMPELDGARALHLFASHPMYICAARSRADLFGELERALERICDDFPKYMRMISEHHYGVRSELSALTLAETEWLAERQKDPTPVTIDFSPWPFTIVDRDTKQLTGFVRLFVNELERKTGLRFAVPPQTGIQTAEARFLRGESDLWVPFPETCGDAVYGANSLLSIPVAQSFLQLIGVEDVSKEFELFARPGLSEELVSILRKVLSGIDTAQLQEMFMSAAAERQIVHRVFGRTRAELSRLILEIAVCVLGAILAFAVFMAVLLRREARRASRAAELSEQHAAAKTRFLAMMSHELRTPLNAVIGFTEFLAREKVDEGRRRDYIDGILLSANALLELINDILDLSKLDAGAMDMRTGLCDVNKLLREIPAIFGYRVRRHGVRLDVAAPKTPIPIIRLSQQGLRQILINLIGNSAKFTEAGSITLSAGWRPETGTLVIDIADTGCGISEEKLSKIFDPFVQDIASRMHENAGEMKGTGLGLPIVKRMVDSARGTISVESRLGEGTKFHIEIPGLALVPGAEPAPASADAGVVTQIVPGRVLVVDDMVVNRKVLGIHLGNLGVQDIRYGENGQDAIDIMKDWIPDLVLTDMWMPVMDGTQLAEAMNRDRRLAEIPVVAITADVDVGSTYDMSLFKKVLAKPVNGDKLRALFGELR
ncbi:MAG: transporter substrate-binding domain-containing protein [Kiritimatiellae bacterium]|nr:transporter substrate-binding domain-containing protein [Kiritimatiellia bacterium]